MSVSEETIVGTSLAHIDAKWIMIVVAADHRLWLQQDSSDTRPLLTIIRQFIDLQLFFKMFTPINAAKTLILIMFSFTLDIYCTSVRPGRGIPHMWLSLRFLLSFYLLKGFFSSFSLLWLRVKGRGCHTLLKPYETNCDLWIWAIQIQFDWLIDNHRSILTTLMDAVQFFHHGQREQFVANLCSQSQWPVTHVHTQTQYINHQCNWKASVKLEFLSVFQWQTFLAEMDLIYIGALGLEIQGQFDLTRVSHHHTVFPVSFYREPPSGEMCPTPKCRNQTKLSKLSKKVEVGWQENPKLLH